MYTIEECSLYKDSIIISGIPVYIFDDHNMALPAWGVSCSRLRQPLNLVTFDKHADTHPSFHSYVFDQTGEAADSTHLGLNNPEINVILKSMHYQPNDFCFEDVFKIAADYLENDEHILAGMDLGYLSSYTVVTREGDEALGGHPSNIWYIEKIDDYIAKLKYMISIGYLDQQDDWLQTDMDLLKSLLDMDVKAKKIMQKAAEEEDEARRKILCKRFSTKSRISHYQCA